jgi:hypothetical protein
MALIRALCLASSTELMLLTWCVRNSMYRQGLSAIEAGPVLPGSASPGHFKLGMIELNDIDESWEKCASLTDPANCSFCLYQGVI